MDTNKENMPPFKKRELSLSLSNRRCFSESSSEEISSLQKVTVTKNTEISYRWAVKNFNDWFTERLVPSYFLPPCPPSYDLPYRPVPYLYIYSVYYIYIFFK